MFTSKRIFENQRAAPSGVCLNIAGDTYYEGNYRGQDGNDYFQSIQGNVLQSVRVNDDGKPVDDDGNSLTSINGSWVVADMCR